MMSERRPLLTGVDPLRLAREAAGRDASDSPFADLIGAEIEASGVAFAVSEKKLQENYYRAIGSLAGCVLPSPSGGPMLIEGGVYRGAWLESTAAISSEILCRFMPSIARSTFELFARLKREDGLIPYKVLPPGADGGPGGPSFRQVQMVTPLARSVWTHAALNRESEVFLRVMYEAMAANDAWLAAHRDTRRSGCVEAFCAFDTGHDLSPRFWHVPDTCFMEDPASYDPASPLLPYIAPDMTANVYCQRLYLSRIASSLGLDGESAEWKTKAERSLRSLMHNCWDGDDEFFYDVDRAGRLVRVQSDVLLRVLACEVGDDELFARCCSRYLLNTRKFFSRFPFTSIAMDDPRWNEPTEVQCLISACWLMKREVVAQVGGLDEAFNPAQFEDFDFCYRARQAGWKVLVEPSVEMYHFENVTTDGSPDVKFRYVTMKNWVEFKRRWRAVYEQEDGPDDSECQWDTLETRPLARTGVPPVL